MNAKHIGYANGAIRNANGKLVAFFDAESNVLTINGHAERRAVDMNHAMEIIGDVL